MLRGAPTSWSTMVSLLRPGTGSAGNDLYDDGDLAEVRSGMQALADRLIQARWAKLIGAGTHYIALLTIASMMVLPLVWMVSTSLKPRKDVFAYPPQFIPKTMQWENYPDAWEAQPFGAFMFNSFKVSILSILGQLLFCSLGGYGFARFHFPFKNALFAFLLAAMMIPTLVNIVPLFILYRELGWLDNHITLQRLMVADLGRASGIAPQALASTFGTFLYRQFMMTIPQELEGRRQDRWGKRLRDLLAHHASADETGGGSCWPPSPLSAPGINSSSRWIRAYSCNPPSSSPSPSGWQPSGKKKERSGISADGGVSDYPDADAYCLHVYAALRSAFRARHRHDRHKVRK